MLVAALMSWISGPVVERGVLAPLFGDCDGQLRWLDIGDVEGADGSRSCSRVGGDGVGISRVVEEKKDGGRERCKGL